MEKRDMISLCIQNLFRRKTRTFLTVLGVLVGCCSIVVMISIGIGTRVSQEKMLAQMGDLTTITVTAPSGGKSRVKLNKESLEKIKKIQDVVYTTPKITSEEIGGENVTLTIYAGNNKRYTAEYVTIVGMEDDAVKNLGIKVKEGKAESKGSYEVLAGENFAYNFSDSLRAPGSNMVDMFGGDMIFGEEGEGGEEAETNRPKPFFNPMDTPIRLEIQIGSEDKKKVTSIPLKVKGIMKGDFAKGEETLNGVLMNMEELRKMVDDAKREAGVKTEKATYSSVLVKTDSIQKVSSVEKAIKRLGFVTNSMESIREPMEKEAKQKQMMLGGLGAISLFVAALGIMNTMIMSISERTKEIGVMKALGCHLKDIRTIFLMEAGVIGLMGGVIGSVLSLIASYIMNLASGGMEISVVPPWLLLFGITFSICIGLGSGIYPANKAVAIPALEAIKHD